jgi:aspartate carbamoyltransferase catalytic subunit
VKTFTSVRSIATDEFRRLVASGCDYRSRLDDGDPIAHVLEGRCVGNLFFEPSTRTRLSFDLAAQRLGGHVITFHPETSSTIKGETLQDTARTVAAIGADVLVIRHSEGGAPKAIAEWTGCPVINAGDGTNEHPTQAVLDLVTMTRRFGTVEGLEVVIAGDIAHSRVANSLSHAVAQMGGRVILAAPENWLDETDGHASAASLDDVVDTADVLYLLRVQTERGGEITDEYVEKFRLTSERASAMKPDAVVMHPGPMNRGVEIADSVADSPRSLVWEQVRNGVPARMAVFAELVGSFG